MLRSLSLLLLSSVAFAQPIQYIESKKVFLVCTPEIPSLHLAREKYQYLHSLDLGDRVTVLLNRCGKRNVLSTPQIEDLLGLPVQFTFPNDYHSVNQAMAEARPAEASSDFGKGCAALATAMLEHKTPATSDKKRFIEFFTISPSRQSLEGRKSNV